MTENPIVTGITTIQLSRLFRLKLTMCLFNCTRRRDLLDIIVATSRVLATNAINVIIAKVELLQTSSLWDEVAVVVATVLVLLLLDCKLSAI